MKRHFFLGLVTALGLTASSFAIDYGIVNFASCITDSKLGKQEQASFESLKNQMVGLLQDTEKQLGEISTKLNDSEYLDGLSPEAIDELKAKFQMLSEELNRYQNQYYQVLNQANMRIIQTVSNSINLASEKVAKDKKLAMIVNKEACFFFNPQLDITSVVISEMDRVFDQEAKKAAATAPAATASTAQPTAGTPAEVNTK